MVSWNRVVIRFNNWYEPNNWYSPILRYKSINAINDFNLNLITFIDNMPRIASNISFLEFQTVFSFIWQKCTLWPANRSSNSIKCNQKCIRFTLHTNRKLPLWTHSTLDTRLIDNQYAILFCMLHGVIGWKAINWIPIMRLQSAIRGKTMAPTRLESNVYGMRI